MRRKKKALADSLGDRLLREYRTEKEALLRELAFLAKISELEEQRARLQDGKPCPLCGSEYHPFAAGNVPESDETDKKIAALAEVIAKAEGLEATIRELQAAQTLARKELSDSEKLQVAANNDKEYKQQTLATQKALVEQLSAEFTQLKQGIARNLSPLGIVDIPDDLVSLRDLLKERFAQFRVQESRKAELDQKISIANSEIKRLQALCEIQHKGLVEKQQQFNRQVREHTTLRDQRITLYGDKYPDNEEIRLNQHIEDSERSLRVMRERTADVRQKLTTATAHVGSLCKRIDHRESELTNIGREFSAACNAAGFAGEGDFASARLATDQRLTLSAEAKTLDDAQTDLSARQKDRESRLRTELAKKLTDQPLAALEPEQNSCENALKQLQDEIAASKHILNESQQAQQRINTRQLAIEAQIKECQRWEKLHGLIGSADGKKYRNFAQGLTFELMVSHANRQLAKMSDRYLLVRDDAQPLQLNVVDNYQAGEIRSTRNLSGGESFIVSLTLAPWTVQNGESKGQGRFFIPRRRLWNAG